MQVVSIACFTTQKAGPLNSSPGHPGNDSASAVVSDWCVEKHDLGPSRIQLVWTGRTACICMCGYALYSVALSLKLHQLLLQQTVIISLLSMELLSVYKNHNSCWGQVFITPSSCWFKSLSDRRELFLWRAPASCFRTTLSHCYWDDSWSRLLGVDQDCRLLNMEFPISFRPNAIIFTG